MLDSGQTVQPGVWPSRHHAQTADAASQYKCQAPNGLWGTATEAAEAGSDTQLLALLSARLQHSTPPPSATLNRQELTHGQPDRSETALSDPLKSQLHMAAARPGRSAAQFRTRQPGVTTVTPSPPSSVGGRQRGTGTWGSPCREAAADTAVQRYAPQKHGGAARLQPVTEAPAKPASCAPGAAPHTAASGHVHSAAQTVRQDDGGGLMHESSAERRLPDAPRAAGDRCEADAGIVTLKDRLATMTSERNAAIAAEFENRKAFDAQARCCLRAVPH